MPLKAMPQQAETKLQVDYQSLTSPGTCSIPGHRDRAVPNRTDMSIPQYPNTPNSGQEYTKTAHHYCSKQMCRHVICPGSRAKPAEQPDAACYDEHLWNFRPC